LRRGLLIRLVEHLAVLLLVNILQKVDLSLNNCPEDLKGAPCADSLKEEVAAVFLNCEMHGPALLCEEVQVRIVVAANLLDNRSIHGDAQSIEEYFVKRVLSGLLVPTEDCDLALVAAGRGLFNLDLNIELMLNLADSIALRPKNQVDKSLVNLDILNY